MDNFRIESYLRVGDLSGEDLLRSSPRPRSWVVCVTLSFIRILRKLLKEITYCICKDGNFD